MKAIYKCRCMPAEVEIDVPDRLPNGDLMNWMETVQQRVGCDHRARSPFCRSTATEYLKLPIDEASQGIGIPVTKQ